MLGQVPSRLLERPSGGDGQDAFVAGGDEPEQRLGGGVIERAEADFIEASDQEPGPQ